MNKAIRYLFLTAIIALGLISIVGSNGGDGGDSSSTIDNSKFYGVFQDVNDATHSVTIGGDRNYWGTVDYLYIPEMSNNATIEGADSEFGNYIAEMHVEGNVISTTVDGQNGTTYYEFTFSNDYDSFTFKRWGYSGDKITQYIRKSY